MLASTTTTTTYNKIVNTKQPPRFPYSCHNNNSPERVIVLITMQFLLSTNYTNADGVETEKIPHQLSWQNFTDILNDFYGG